MSECRSWSVAAVLFHMVVGGKEVQSPPSTLLGSPLLCGQLVVSASLPNSTTCASTWLGAADDQKHEAYLETRRQLLQNVSLFRRFRRTDPYAYVAGPVVRDRMTEDDRYYVAWMCRSPLGQSLLALAPNISYRYDAFGSPHLITLPEHHPAGIRLSLDLVISLYWIGRVVDSINRLIKANNAAWADMTRLPPGWDVVEVGAGMGFFAAALARVGNPGSYSIIDLPEMQALQLKVLRHALPLGQVMRTFAFIPPGSPRLSAAWVLPEYDLFLSFFAFSELTLPARRTYFEAFVSRSRRGFIVDNAMDWALHGGSEAAAQQGGFALTGLQLVHELLGLGFQVRVRTFQEETGLEMHRSRAVVISWLKPNLLEE